MLALAFALTLGLVHGPVVTAALMPDFSWTLFVVGPKRLQRSARTYTVI
jgi:hypothetical protein